VFATLGFADPAGAATAAAATNRTSAASLMVERWRRAMEEMKTIYGIIDCSINR
jgi:hypothetical protein